MNSYSNDILFTDHYQLTMAQLYFNFGIHERNSQFEHFFRNYPDYGSHQAGYCINAGLEWLIRWIRQSAFSDNDIAYLKSLETLNCRRLFSDEFLGWLRHSVDFNDITLQAQPEGRVVHPDVPLTVVKGPLAAAQLLESSLLNKLNYQTLIATKAARIKQAGRGSALLEFGMRRGQDAGVNAGARAAVIGGADLTSNVLMSKELKLTPGGTHAHSMVQAFIALGEGELGAFRAYADTYPDNCLLLVDTIDTLESGVPNAIRVFDELRRKGHRPLGIRLDSGDLAYLSIQCSKMLDSAGYPDVRIVLSNQLDELVILQILTQIEEEAPRYGVDADNLISRLVYGVGTRLITSAGDSALDGVYKLVAIDGENCNIPTLKLSDSPEKILNPGNKRVFRIYDLRGKSTADVMSLDDIDTEDGGQLVLRHPSDHTKYRIITNADISAVEPLLKPIIESGRLVYDFPSLEDIRKQREHDLNALDPGVKRIMNPHIYHVSLTEDLWDMKKQLIYSMKNGT